MPPTPTPAASPKAKTAGRPGSLFGLGKEREGVLETLTMLISSGMPIISALTAIQEETRSGRMRSILNTVLADVESGSPLWKAFAAARFFPDHTLSLIRLGEESGKLVENLQVVAVEQEKNLQFRSKVRSAMMYPVFVLGLTVVIAIGISWFILPKLALVFAQLHMHLPLVTRILIRLGVFLGKYGAYAVPIVLLSLAAIAYVLFFDRRTKKYGQAMLSVVPGIRQLLQEVELARFGYLLGTLLEAGLPVTQSLQSLATSTEDRRYRKLYFDVSALLQDGNSFQKSFAATLHSKRLIPMPIQRLISSGEQSGSLSSTLLKIGRLYEGKSDTSTKNLSVILEPVLLVVVWLGVVAVAMAVILPIYNLVGSFNT